MTETQKRVAIKRQLRKMGHSIPEKYTFCLGALRVMRKWGHSPEVLENPSIRVNMDEKWLQQIFREV